MQRSRTRSVARAPRPAACAHARAHHAGGLSIVGAFAQTLVEHVAALRSRSVRLSKAKRYLKHVQGHSTETLARMANGTLTTDSAWGPHKVIRGEGGGAEGAVWGTRAPAGRKRRDAAWYRERAVKGNDKAQLQLGLAYLEGAGVARNQSRGAGWLARSAKQGNLRAMHELAQCYRFGEGVLRHNASAVQLLKQAARKGHLQAQEDLGVAHMDGLLGLPRDAQAALTALRLAAQSGSRRAATRLGVLFAEGRDGVPPDERMAEMYLLRAARSYRTSHASGSSEVREGARALFKLARRFLEGRGVRQDIFKARCPARHAGSSSLSRGVCARVPRWLGWRGWASSSSRSRAAAPVPGCDAAARPRSVKLPCLALTTLTPAGCGLGGAVGDQRVQPRAAHARGLLRTGGRGGTRRARGPALLPPGGGPRRHAGRSGAGARPAARGRGYAGRQSVRGAALAAAVGRERGQ
jgi:TPR repeat protein